jgi:hypothetical protein
MLYRAFLALVAVFPFVSATTAFHNYTDDELDALLDLYHHLHGEEWGYAYARIIKVAPDKVWNGTNYCNWAGVYCNNDQRVDALVFGNFNASGIIPYSISVFKAARKLDFSRNKISGTIPTVLTSLKNLEAIDLTANSLSGTIPANLGTLDKLANLYLSTNNLTSHLPFPLPPQLQELNVQNNSLSGSVDYDWPQQIEFVNLALNYFSGSFPAKIYQLSYLHTLILRRNSFSGEIVEPDSIESLGLQVFDISFNSFEGFAPAQLLSLANLLIYDISHNKISGSLLDLLQYRKNVDLNCFQSPPYLASMDLSFNSFDPTPGDDITYSILDLAFNWRSILTLNFDGLALSSPLYPIGFPYNPLFFLGSQKRVYPEKNFECSETQYSGEGLVCSSYFPPEFWNFSNCECSQRYWGKAPQCEECPDNLNINCEGEFLFLPGGLSPVLNKTSGELLGFLNCHKFSDGTSPCKNISLEYGDIHFEEELCAHGYAGRLCRECECEGHSEKCFFSSGEECQECKEVQTWIIIGGALAMVACVLIFIFLKGSKIMLFLEAAIVVLLLFLGIGQSYVFDVLVFFLLVQGLEIFGKDSENEEGIVSIEGLAKLFLWYLQALSLLVPSEFWPEQIKSAISNLEVVNFHSSSIACTHVMRSFSEIVGKEVSKLLVVAIVPVLLAAGMVVTLGLRRLVTIAKKKYCGNSSHRRSTDDTHYEKFATVNAEDSFVTDSLSAPSSLLLDHPSDQDGWNMFDLSMGHGHHKNHEPPFSSELASMLLFVTYATLVEVSATVFESLSCTADPFTGEYFMTDAPAVSCESPEYHMLQKIAWPMFILWVLGVPAVFAGLLYKNRAQLSEHETEAWLGLLYENYSAKCWWWELVWIARRILLAGAVAWLEESPWKNPAVSSILVGSICLMFHFRPFKFSGENSMELAVTGVLLVTWSANLNESVDYGVRWTLVAVNCILGFCFLFLFCYQPVRMLISKVRQKQWCDCN